jgi:acetylornithine deacetylase/succinyl-diaminopimelate desuccinylase-like protein
MTTVKTSVEKSKIKTLSAIAAAFVLAACGNGLAAEPLSPELAAFRQIYQELVEINTTDSVGNTLRAAEAMAARLKAAGLPAADIQVISTTPRKGNLVARLRGTGALRPILLLAHIDVVEAPREDWDSDPFKLEEKDGMFGGRGVIDDKAMAASFVANLIQYVKEGFKPERDIIVALTTDEELSDSPHDGARVLLQNHRALVDAELALNEGGGGTLRGGKPFRMGIQLAEKVYQTYVFEVTDPGGHSASPRRENPIYRLADALRKLAAFDFPVRLNAVTRANFEQLALTETPPVAEAIKAMLAGRTDPQSLAPLNANAGYNAQMRTTCVATLLEAGHAENALPQTARATVNCRVLPDESVDEVSRTLARVVDDGKVAITPKGQAVLSPPSPPRPDVMEAVSDLAREMWPGVALNTSMSAGYTDSRWARNAGIPAYGVSGLFSDSGNNGVHGRNERIGVQAVYDSKTFLYRLVKRLAAPSAQ